MRHLGDHASAHGADEPADQHQPPPFPQSRARRRPRNRALTLLCVLLAVGGSSAIAYALVTAPAPPAQPTAAQAGALDPSGTRHPRATPPQMPASPPTRVRIPSIGVDATVDTLGLNPDGTVEVPGKPDDAGWYDGSAAPGRIGAAVLLGHVDFVSTGPAVFYRLGELKPGAVVSVAREDGSTAKFTVNAVREFLKSAFPTGEVYGPTDGTAQLRLITCGDWDEHQGKYIGNIVVFATLDPSAAAGTPSPKAHADAPRGPR